jgi:hypothetical protein
VPDQTTSAIIPKDISGSLMNEHGKKRENILDVPAQRELREELQTMVAADLLGPAGGPEEEIGDEAQNVRDRYILGVLAPRYRVEKEESEPGGDELAQGGGSDGDDGSADTGAPQKGTMFPSSLGFTFHVAGEVESLLLRAFWGRYERVKSEVLTTDKGDPKTVWRRIPVEGRMTLPLSAGRIQPWSPCEECPDVKVRGIVRRKEGERDWTVTLFLVNGQKEPLETRDQAWLFQAGLSVEAPGSAPIFVKRESHRRPGKLDQEVYREIKSLEMMYRRRAEFAVGHGIAVHAAPDDHNPLRACRLTTTALPLAEVPAVEPASIPGLTLDMKELTRTGNADLAAVLSPLTDAYAAWIGEQRARLARGDDYLGEYAQVGADALSRCEAACARIREGIALLASDPHAGEAFRFANRAMWLQRIHSLYAERRRQGDKAVKLTDLDTPPNRTWRPFQLAFILLNLPGITGLDHADRAPGPNARADLLWFPTGGGKTEAYLGLTAYTLGLRRLQGKVAGRDGEAGVAVLMRYTLRLLTLQQFQRAAALICACEAIRREAADKGDGKWGGWPFRIGLWVGNKTTPNTTEQSAQANLERREKKSGGGVGDPAQLTACPWCGTEINPGVHVTVDKVRGRTLMYCGDPTSRCLFSAGRSPDEGLPVLVVDEEIYRQLPALLIATVDKFAQMPWNGVTQMLFGQVNGYCPRHGFRSTDLDDSDSHPKQGKHPAVQTVPHGPLRPPDLIIQDELHLISGPLGSLVGLYETAVDYLASWEVEGRRVRPKVIASTATIRNARAQVHKTFGRSVCVFPPQGLDAEDNFFARQSDLTQKPGRLYVGVCSPGRRLKSVLIRVYIAYLAAGQALFDKYGNAADLYMTAVGYFNSMRELGGMRRLVDDDIRSGLGHADRRGFPKRALRSVEELTSRRHSTDIPQILDQLEVPHTGVKDARLPIDVLLATNMISVGVDVKRLGLMVVANQPKTTAEYIQATSRVGRTFPGIVCTVLNWARPRDLSHYERFEHYHGTFYQFVEALSVTPFAPRALDRGLSALLVASVRLPGTPFNGNADAADIDQHHPFVASAKDVIGERAALVEGDNAAGQRVRAALSSRVDAWASRAQHMTGGATLGYKTKNDGKTFGLLQTPGTDPWQDFTCLNSLRDVEPMVNLILDNYGMDDPQVTEASSPSAVVAEASAPADEEGDDLLL